ncbi:MAG: energy-coupling factor transporter transmembrane component T family protein [Gemmatimonadales bacterium]
MIGYVQRDSILHRAHPTTILWLAILFTTAAFTQPATVVAFVASAGVALPFLARSQSVLKSGAVVLSPLLFFAVLLHGILGHDPERAVLLGSRLIILVMVFLTVVAVVHPGRLVDAITERGVRFSIAYLFAASLTAVPAMRERARLVVTAQRCRGLRVGRSAWAKLRALPPLLIPLVVSSLESVDARSVALAVRGAHGATRRTPIDPPADSAMQRLLRLLILMICMVLVWLRLTR